MTQALVESVLLAVAGGIAGLVVAIGTARLLLALAFAGATLPADRHASGAAGPGVRVRARARDRHRVRRRAGVVRDAHRSDRRASRRRAAARAITRRSRARRCSSCRRRLSVVLVAGSMMLARSLGNLESQDFGFEIQGRVLVALNRPPATYTADKLAALNRDVEERLNRAAGCARRGTRALQPAHRQLGRAGAGGRPSRAEARRAGRRVVGSRQRELPPEPGREARPRASLQRGRQRDVGDASRS